MATYDIRIGWAANVTNPFTIGTSTLGGGDQLGGTFLVDFAGPYDDVALDTEEFTIRRGRDDPLTPVQAGRCELTLFDLDGRYNPLNSSSPIFGQMIPMRQVKITATELGVTYPLFRGFIRSMEFDPNDRRTQVVAEDLMLWLSRTRPVVGPTSGKTGALIQAVLTASGWTLPMLTDVDVTAGDTVSNFSLDGTSESRTALQAIADLLESERGLFFIEADGTAHYRDRHEQGVQPSLSSLTDVFTNAVPGTSIETVINRSRVTKEGGVTQTSENTASVELYGPGDLSIESPYFEDDVQAASLASYLTWLYSTPTAPLWALPLIGNVDSSTMAAVLSRELGDRVTLTSTQAGFTGDFYIESIMHHVRSASMHHTEWSLTRRPEVGELFVIGESTLGGGDILAYY